MGLYYRQMNRQIFSILRTYNPTNNKLGFNSILLNKSFIHSSASLKDSNDQKKKSEAIEADKLNNKLLNKNKLSNFKLISLNDTQKKYIPSPSPSPSSPSVAGPEKNFFTFKQENVFVKKPHQQQQYKSNTDLKNEFKDALNVAKLIDKNSPKKTAEILMAPLIKMREKSNANFKKQQNLKRDLNQGNNKNDTEFRSLLNKGKIDENEENTEISIIGRSKRDEEEKNRKLEEQNSQKPRVNKYWKGSPYQTIQNLKSGNGLSIFTDVKQSEEKATTKESAIWSMHFEQELKLAQEIPPINGFDEMIQLTDEGKLWKFPIDNEQDIDELEAKIPFHEHIFLDYYLEEFPQIEPIQQFMTLALNGISQNSYLSLNEKKEIIDWYKSYFNEKLDIIKEALEAEKMELFFRESLGDKAS